MRKTFAAIFLIIGFVFIMISIAGLLGIGTHSPQEKSMLAFAGMFFGLPPTVIGLMLVKSIQKQKKHSEHKRSKEIESAFLQEIQVNNGVVNPVCFAIAAKLSIEEAKEYLDLKSKQLNGTFDTNENGGIYYVFNI